MAVAALELVLGEQRAGAASDHNNGGIPVSSDAPWRRYRLGSFASLTFTTQSLKG